MGTVAVVVPLHERLALLAGDGLLHGNAGIHDLVLDGVKRLVTGLLTVLEAILERLTDFLEEAGLLMTAALVLAALVALTGLATLAALTGLTALATLTALLALAALTGLAALAGVAGKSDGSDCEGADDQG